MAIDRQLVLQCFLAETEEALAEVEQALLGIERGVDQPDAMQAIFRHVHTLKGNAASLGFPLLATYAHQVEDAFEPLRGEMSSTESNVVSTSLAVVDALRAATHATVAGGVISQDAMRCLESLRAATGSAGTILAAAPDSGSQAKQSRDARAATLRVQVEKLDRMLDLIGEIGIANARLRVGCTQDQAVGANTLIVLEEIERLYLQLQEHVMDARMVPVGPVFRRFVRTVRDTAAQLGKEVDLVLEGEEVGVDTAVVETIRDPLMHVLRNAVDHGIEPPEQREHHGKPRRGRILLRAAHEAGTILIEVIDDGAGLNVARIHERAVKLGFIAEHDRLTSVAAAELVLRPGFSTATSVTETSGRGVGMDVVRRNVQALHGQLEIHSHEGKGTTVAIRLPLTLAVLDGFLVRVGTDMFLLPVDAIQECLDAQQVAQAGCTALLDVRGAMVPALRLGALFRSNGGAQSTAVLVRHNAATAALVVDELLGSYQAVIKPLGKIFRNVAGVSGSTILGDGRVALVLDIPGLFREAVRTHGPAATN